MNQYRILLVDDEPTLRELMCEMLKGEGYQIVQANNGLEAKTILETEKFDLLITDLRMPKMDGTQLLDWCRKSKIHFPVIFVTASSELLASDDLALKDCCVAVLHKPFDLNNIITAVTDAKTRNHQLNC